MSGVGSVSASASSSPAAASPASASGSTTNLPPGLANLTAGTILTGSVIGRDGSGHTLVRTANGILALSTSVSLPAGSTVSLQVQSVGAQIQLAVLSVNQQPPQGPGPPIAFLLLPATAEQARINPNAAAGLPLDAEPAVLVEAGALVTATLSTVFRRTAPSQILPGQASGETPEQAAAVVAAVEDGAVATEIEAEASALTAKAGIAPGASTAQGTAATVAAGTAATAAPGPSLSPALKPATSPALTQLQHLAEALVTSRTATPAPASARAPASLFDLPEGTRFQVRVVAVEPDTQRDALSVLRAAASGQPDAKLLLGKLIGPSSNGEAQVRTAFGVFTLASKSPLTPSGHIVLELVGEPLPPVPSPHARPIVPAESDINPLSQSWPALKDAITALASTDVAQAQHLAQAVVPRPGIALALNTLVLMAALRSGDVRSWLGDAVTHALTEIGRSDLVTKLGHDFTQMARFAAVPQTGDWRAFLIPLYDGTNVQFARFSTKRNRKKQKSHPDSEAARFLLDIELSRLGMMQLDGLMRLQRFDMIIRSHTPLPAEIRHDLSAIFADSLENAGFDGGLTYQAPATFASAPISSAAADRVGLSV